MPKREIGLMGYVGEQIVEQWLRHKYPNSQLVSQIIPSDVPKNGGAYLDFGVISNNMVEAIFEVKSQDYILGREFPINKALKHIWEKNGLILEFETQDKKKYKSYEKITAKLILLVGANEDGIDKIGINNISNIILFSDIWKDEAFRLQKNNIIENMEHDLNQVINIFQAPSQGKIVTEKFLEKRSIVMQKL